MGQLSRKIAIFVLMAGGLVATAIAGPKPDPAPKLEVKPIPSGMLDIDFRSSGWSFTNDDEPQEAREAKKGIVIVTASEGTLRSLDCGDVPDCPTGFAVYVGSDEGLEKGEYLTVDMDAVIIADPTDEFDGGVGSGTAAFDVDGVWLTGFVQAKNGEAGVIEIVGVDPNDRRAYSFSWKDVDPGDITDVCTVTGGVSVGNCNNDFFVGFGETLRINSAVLTTTSGAFSVAGFSKQPILIEVDNCEGQLGCKNEIAQNVFLDILQRKLDGVPGDRGVTGELVKEGVYVVDDPRAQCQPGFDPNNLPSLAYAQWSPLSINLDADVNSPVELVMQRHQCGYPNPKNSENPNQPVIYVLELDGSRLEILEDTIPVRFIDDADPEQPDVPDEYFCNASDPFKRPGYGWAPVSQRSMDSGDYEEIPLLDENGVPILEPPVQDVTTGPCGSGRGGFSRFSYVVYHWVNAPGTPYELAIGERIDRLQVYVGQLFPCVQQGVNQSTLSDDTGHIRKSFDMGGDRGYQRAVDYIAEMREHVLDSRLNDEISECFFDLGTGKYVKNPVSKGVAANVVGNLLVQLDHLRWMIRSTLLGEMPGNIPKLD